ncbi:hypothetical protein LR066_00150 [candidate division WOR-3 bacterium]|nr:hypothetical protein [candidate division WOR-3 bacterium]
MWRDIIVIPFSFGILSSIGICLASCTPILVSYLISTKKEGGEFFSGILFLATIRAVTFILSLIIIFIIGDIARQFIEGHTLLLRIIGGAFISAIGAIIFFNKHVNIRFFGTRSTDLFILAVLFGIKPCLPHIAMWGYCLIAAENVSQAALLGVSFSLGENVAPIVIGFLGSRVIRYFRGRAYKIATKIAGAVIFILGIVFILGEFIR